jgi:hypothetical protein
MRYPSLTTRNKETVSWGEKEAVFVAARIAYECPARPEWTAQERPATKFLAKSENKAGANSNRVRPPPLPRRINRYVRGLPCFLVSLPLLQFGPCYPTCPIQRSL